jgi:cytochrome c biogenesis protein CcmG/thiol:disulfide interchange protein DsbE
VLVDFAKQKLAPLIGLNYKDQSPEAKNWLARFGNPYDASVVDADGRVGIDYGVYGVPETYVIDKTGTIRFKQIGPVTPEVLQKKIVPLIKELQK